VIELVDVTVTMFPPVRVLFAWEAFGEIVKPVPTEIKDAAVAVREAAVKFDSVPPVARNSNDPSNAASEDVSGFEDAPPLVSESKDALEDPVAVLAPPKVLFP
jgi:hypothetical protein